MRPLCFFTRLNFGESMEFSFIIFSVLRISIIHTYNKHCKNEKPTAQMTVGFSFLQRSLYQQVYLDDSNGKQRE